MRVIFGGPDEPPAFERMSGGPAAEGYLALAAPPPIIAKPGLVKAPPAFLLPEKPKLGLLETVFWPVPVIWGRIMGLVPVASPPPSIFYISPAIKSSTLSLPNLPFMSFSFL